MSKLPDVIPLRTTKPQPRPAPETPAAEALGLLTACHERIRRFADAAVLIATMPGISGAEISDAAKAIHRYFSIALPLHIQDEDVSLQRRLEPHTNRTMREALTRITHEHVTIEQSLQQLLPLWTLVIGEPYRVRELDLRKPSEALRAAFEAHLLLEEQQIFPAILQLSEDSAVRIVSEMRARRSPTTHRATDPLSE